MGWGDGGRCRWGEGGGVGEECAEGKEGKEGGVGGGRYRKGRRWDGWREGRRRGKGRD